MTAAKRKTHGESDEPEDDKAPLPSAYTAADVEAAITRARAAAQELDTALAAAETQAAQYRAVADRLSDVARGLEAGEKTLADLTAEVEAARVAHEQEVAEWAQTSAAEKRTFAEGLEARRVKMEGDIERKARDLDAAHAAREAKLHDAEQAAQKHLQELQDEIRQLTRQHADLYGDLNRMQQVKDNIRQDIAILKARMPD